VENQAISVEKSVDYLWIIALWLWSLFGKYKYFVEKPPPFSTGFPQGVLPQKPDEH
jgi:hypothetical protein